MKDYLNPNRVIAQQDSGAHKPESTTGLQANEYGDLHDACVKNAYP